MSGERTQYPIAAVLEALGGVDVPVVSSGHRKMLCPFHGERNPSASVSRYGFKCWSCGESGDAVKLMRKHLNLSYLEAVAECERLVGAGDVTTKNTSKGWGLSILDP